MSAYITKTYFETMFSVDQLNALLSYGNISSTADKNAKIDLIISQSSAIVDSYLAPAGYDLPLSTVPSNIEFITFWIAADSLFSVCAQPLPDSYKDKLGQSYLHLEALRNKQTQLPGLTQNPETGAGANMFAFSVSDNDTPTLFARKNLRGSFF